MKPWLALLSLFSAASLHAEMPRSVLDLSLEPPAVNTHPGPEYADAVRTGNMIIGIERTPKGRLWACWVGNGDNPNGFFMLASSEMGAQVRGRARARSPSISHRTAEKKSCVRCVCALKN